jgi:hypothetical protein
MVSPVVLRRRLPGLTQQPIQRNHLRGHQQRHVQDRNGIPKIGRELRLLIPATRPVLVWQLLLSPPLTPRTYHVVLAMAVEVRTTKTAANERLVNSLCLMTFPSLSRQRQSLSPRVCEFAAYLHMRNPGRKPIMERECLALEVDTSFVVAAPLNRPFRSWLWSLETACFEVGTPFCGV